VLDLFCFHHPVDLSYLEKATKAFPLTPSRYEMAAKTVAWGTFAPSLYSNTHVNNIAK